MPRSILYDIESPMKSLSSMTKNRNGLLIFLIILVLFMAIYIPTRVLGKNNDDS
jgi:hypothetical protein